MERENFFPKGLSDVIRLPDGRIKQIVAVCQGKKILINVVNGKPKRQDTPEIPYFKIPDDRFHVFYEQVRAIISGGKKKAEQFTGIKKLDWTANLVKCGITIGSDGKVIIPRRHTNKKTGERKRVLMPARDINSAIRMQDHVMKYYDPSLPAELSRVLKRFNISHLELRREVLLYAKQQMQSTIDESFAKLKRIMASTADDADDNGPKFNVLADKIARLAFFLKNQWTCPYLDNIKLVILHLNRAKKAAAKSELQTVQLQLWSAKQLMTSLVDMYKRQSGMEKLSAIDPIKTLAEVDRRNKADEVLTLAKLRLGGEVFHLTNMLVISREVLEKEKSVPRQEVSHSVVPQPAVSQPTTSLPPVRRKKRTFNFMRDQSAFDFSG